MPELNAYHEAGHALMAILLGGEVRSVTIEPDNDDGPDRQGDTQVLWRRSRMSEKQFAETAIQVSLAGPVAEMIYSGEPYHPGLIADGRRTGMRLGKRRPYFIVMNGNGSHSWSKRRSAFIANFNKRRCGRLSLL